MIELGLNCLTLVKLQVSHFPKQKGIKRVLCKIATDLSFVMNVFVYIYFFKPVSQKFERPRGTAGH